jgi:hypothetical protein
VPKKSIATMCIREMHSDSERMATAKVAPAPRTEAWAAQEDGAEKTRTSDKVTRLSLASYTGNVAHVDWRTSSECGCVYRCSCFQLGSCGVKDHTATCSHWIQAVRATASR